MQPDGSAKKSGETTKVSPLQRVDFSGKPTRIFLKREDMLLPGGGNKVRRFDAYFAQHSTINRLVTLSDPGAHTFFILKEYLVPRGQQKSGARSFLFLERKRKTNAYLESIRQSYLQESRITVNQNYLLIQLLKYLWYKISPWTRTIGIGGKTSLNPNPFTNAMAECVKQLDEYDLPLPTVHLLPLATGTMMDGFITFCKRYDQGLTQTLSAVLTGSTMTFPWLRLRYRPYSFVKLYSAKRYSWNTYGSMAKNFHTLTGVWLDPIHTIHLVETFLWESQKPESKQKKYVFWITCPKINHDPTEPIDSN